MESTGQHSAECGQHWAMCTLWPCKHDLCCATHSKEVHKCPKCKWPIVKVTLKYSDPLPGVAKPDDAKGKMMAPWKGKKKSTRKGKKKEKSTGQIATAAAAAAAGGRLEEERKEAETAPPLPGDVPLKADFAVEEAHPAMPVDFPPDAEETGDEDAAEAAAVAASSAAAAAVAATAAADDARAGAVEEGGSKALEAGFAEEDLARSEEEINVPPLPTVAATTTDSADDRSDEDAKTKEEEGVPSSEEEEEATPKTGEKNDDIAVSDAAAAASSKAGSGTEEGATYSAVRDYMEAEKMRQSSLSLEVENKAADYESEGGGDSVPVFAAASEEASGKERAQDVAAPLTIVSMTGTGSGGEDGATYSAVKEFIEVGTKRHSTRIDELRHKVEDFEQKNKEHYKSHIVEHSAVSKIKEKEAAKKELVAKLSSHGSDGEEEKPADMPTEMPAPTSRRVHWGVDKKDPGKLSTRRIGYFSSLSGKSRNAPTAA